MEPLLHYSIQTNPFPLQASTSSSNPVIAKLTVVTINNTGKEVTLQGVTIQFPIGQNTDQLTNDARSIVAKAPDNWRLDDARYSQGFVKYIFYPNVGFGKVPVNQSLGFDFSTIAVNCEPGTFKVEIIEGSSGSPVKALSVTKFPNGFAPVSFCVKPVEIPVGGSTTLEWNGPQGATYSIEYYTPQTDIVKIPAPGQPPLLNQGIYPGKTDPPLILQESTMFTLNVDQTIGDQQYHTQEQKWVIVEILQPEISSFTADPAIGDFFHPSAIKLAWQTKNVSKLKIDNVGYFTDTAANGSCMALPQGSTQYFATAYGLEGYSGAPAGSSLWVYFGGVVVSDYFCLITEGEGPVWTLDLGQGHKVFSLDLQISGGIDRKPGYETNYDLYLKLEPGVTVADLGYQGVNAGYMQLVDGVYGAVVPMSHLYSGSCLGLSNDIVFKEQPMNRNATWGIKSPNGLLVLLWLDNILPRYKSPVNEWSFVFKWITYKGISG